MRYFVVITIALLVFWLGFPSWANSSEAVADTDAPLVYVVPIKGAIMDRGLTYFVRHSVEVAKRDKASLIIFEINTPGGAVEIGKESYTLGICNAINNARPISTVAYITLGGLSAGVLISISCDQIVMKQEAVIGAAEPIAGGGGPNPHQEKYTSAFTKMFKARAEKKNYPFNLVMAMVDKDLEVIEVKIDGQQDFLTPDEIEEVLNEGKEVTKVKTVIKKGKLLTLTASEAKAYGLASAIIEDRAEIPVALYQLNNPMIKEMVPTWSESLVIFLTNPLVAGILILVGMISIGMALKTPGFGVPETVGIICLLLIFFGHYLAGLAAATELLLFVVGIILLIVEIFVLPGFGIAGISGLFLIFASLILAMQDFNWPRTPWQWDTFQGNLVLVTISLALALVILVTIVRLLPVSPYLSRLILKTSETSNAGFTVASGNLAILVGKNGTALTALRPSGKIKIAGEPFDAVAEGEFIKKDDLIEVIQVEGSRIVVARPLAPGGQNKT